MRDRVWTRRILLFSVVLLGLAACGPGPVVSPRQRTDQSWNFASGVMVSGPLLVEIRGTPYAVPQERLDDVVLEEMVRAITWSASARFTTDPTVAGSESLRIVLAFNSGPGGRAQCREQAGGGEPTANGAVRLNATLCDADVLLSDVAGLIERSAGIDDPAFRELVRQTTRALLPRRRERNRGLLLVN